MLKTSPLLHRDFTFLSEGQLECSSPANYAVHLYNQHPLSTSNALLLPTLLKIDVKLQLNYLCRFTVLRLN